MTIERVRYGSPRRTVIIGMAVVALAVGGCGSSGSSSSDPSDVVSQFFDDFAAGDSKGCSLLTPEAQDKVGVGTSTCESAIEQFGALAKAQLEGLEIGAAEIDGDRATVSVKTAAKRTTVTLQRDGDSWLISSLGSGQSR